ncbi:MAG: ABC transporter permease subunit [Bdellovibrionota bacterium]
MIRYSLKKLALLAITFLGLSIVAFSLIRMVPGDPVLMMLGERGASPESYAEMKATLGLDQPYIKQFGLFIWHAVHGDLGNSIVSNQSVVREFFDRFPATLELSVVALLFAMMVGLPLGIIAAIKRNTFFDYAFMGVSLVGYSMPIFWWGLILILVASVNVFDLPFFGWTPVSGRISPMFEIDSVTGFLFIDVWFSKDSWAAFWDALKHVLLPAIAMGTIPLAVIARMTRSSLLEVLGEDYIRTAKAKGLSTRRVIMVHALRNAMIPIVTVIGLSFGMVIKGAILTETIFSWPGIGRWLVNSVTSLDYPVIQGGVLLIGMAIVVVNLIVDLAYLWIDPKLRDAHDRSK